MAQPVSGLSPGLIARGRGRPRSQRNGRHVRGLVSLRALQNPAYRPAGTFPGSRSPTGNASAVSARTRTPLPAGERRRRLSCDSRRGVRGEPRQRPRCRSALSVFSTGRRLPGQSRRGRRAPRGEDRVRRETCRRDPRTARSAAAIAWIRRNPRGLEPGGHRFSALRRRRARRLPMSARVGPPHRPFRWLAPAWDFAPLCRNPARRRPGTWMPAQSSRWVRRAGCGRNTESRRAPPRAGRGSPPGPIGVDSARGSSQDLRVTHYHKTVFKIFVTRATRSTTGGSPRSSSCRLRFFNPAKPLCSFDPPLRGQVVR